MDKIELTPFLEDTIRQIVPPSEVYGARCRERWNRLCKPIRGFGTLEDIVCRIGAVQHTEDPRIDRAAIVIMGADNGVVRENVSQCGSGVTAQVLRNMANRKSSVCVMSSFRPADVFPVDIGLNRPAGHPGVRSCAVRRGTGDIRTEPAMSRREACLGIETGIRMAAELKEKGYQILIPGEMGIGNTTTSAACVCVFFEKDPADIAGRGAGLPEEGLARKRQVIRDAIFVNRPDRRDAADVLAKVGGLDIAGMTGLFLGAAAYGLPVIVDGFIAALAAYIAFRISPESKAYLIPGHESSEPGDRILLDALGLSPGLSFGMRLGEGTGAALLLPVLDEALYVYRNLPVFAKSGIKPYKEFD